MNNKDYFVVLSIIFGTFILVTQMVNCERMAIEHGAEKAWMSSSNKNKDKEKE